MESDDKSKENPKLTRRKFVKACVGASAAAAIGGTTISMLDASFPPELVGGIKSLAFEYYVNKDDEEKGELWYSQKGGTDALSTDFEVGKGASLIWMKRIPTVIMRLEKEKFKNIAEGMVEDGDNVLVAFSAKCTHLCCLPNWMISKPELEKIYCPCHDSVFDPFDVIEEEYSPETTGEKVTYLGARRIAGPAPRGIPLIPIEVKEGKIFGLPTAFPWLIYCGMRV